MMSIIDGTGPYSPEQYRGDFTNSFCHQTSLRLQDPEHYYPGPGYAGVTTGIKACKALLEIREYHQVNPAEDLFLMGYSRGGAAVIQIAKWCNSDKLQIPIKAMFLLDPVCKDLSVDSDGIPSNVEKCYVLYRDLNILEYNAPLDEKDYEDWKDKVAVGFSNTFTDGDPDRYRRKWMENCKVCHEPTNHTTWINAGRSTGTVPGGSHGAVGGVPWVERSVEKGATQEAANRINSWFRYETIPAKIQDLTFIQANTSRIRSKTDAELEADMLARRAEQSRKDRERAYHNASKR
jgi:hypothetical protein